jgi:exodeoxyribonuclease V beta subunit
MTIETLDALRFPLHHSRLIEASAGTGKTYTIAALYLRLVLNHGAEGQRFGRALQPSELLVVTFTEAATEELRDRIRARLSEAARFFAGHQAQADPLLHQLAADYPDQQQWPALAQRLEDAAQAMDEAAVHTIHGWCNRMLREHAFASGSLFTQQLNTDSKQQWLSLARDYWRNHVQLLDGDQRVNYQRLRDLLQNPSSLYQKVRPLLNAAVVTAESPACATPEQLLAHYQQAEQQLRRDHHGLPWLLWLDQAWQQLEQYWDTKSLNGHKLRRGYAEAWFKALREWATSLADDDASVLPKLSESAWSRLSHDGLLEALKQQRSDDPLLQLPLWQGLAELAQAAAQLPDYSIGILEHAAGWLQQRFTELQAQRAEIGFDDMLTRLKLALQGRHGARLAELIRSQFPLAMIDEFQDTDPTQYAIFDAIYRLAEPYPDTGIFLIGDPKQAIYSFRNADIYTYLQARRDTSPRHYTLAVNYRSTEAMVAASNSLFLPANEYAAGAFLFKHQQDDPVPFIAVTANGLKRHWQIDGQPAAALQWFAHTDPAKANKNELLARLAEHCAEQMAALLNGSATGFVTADGELTAVQPADMAVLVNSGSEARVIRAALRKRQIPSVYLSDRDSVFAGPLARDLLIILRACASPRDPQLLRAALATELLHLSLAELEQLKQDERSWDLRADQFMHYHQAWQRQGVLAMLQRLYHDFALPARLLDDADQGERQLTDALHLAELLQQQMRQVEGMTGLLRYLDEHIEACKMDGNRTDSEEQQVRLESDSKLVQVITIHKSKGLQYPLVFLPFISYCQGKDYRVRLPARYHDAQGQPRLVFSKDDSVAYQQADRERLAEDLRKLYVAVTRAQYATFIGLAQFKDWSASALSYLATGEIDSKDSTIQHLLESSQAPQQLVEKTTALQRYQGYVGAKSAVEQCCVMPQQHRFEPWWVSSYSALTYSDSVVDDATSANVLEEQHNQAAATAATAPTFAAADTIHSFAKGAEPGTLLHNLLEATALQGFSQVAGDLQLQQQLLQRVCAAPQWHSYWPMLSHWFEEFLTVSFALPAEQGRLSLAQLTHYQAEPEFWFVANHVDTQAIDNLVATSIHPGISRPALQAKQLNGMLKGFIDLLFEYQGRYYVLDYKSNYLGPDSSSYDHTALRDKMLASRYDLQYVIYLVALHKLLSARLGAQYDYDQHIGGAVYLFMRGYQHPSAGAYCERPPRQLIEQLADLFTGPTTTLEESR